jgi:glutaredoxin
MNTANDQTTTTDQIDLYWRPGCGFCSLLRRGLDKLGIERVEHNIWDEQGGAATVRQYANGNETVPTVVVGGTGLVNPSPNDLVTFLAEHAPHLLPDGVEPTQPGKVGRFVGRVLGS